MQSLAGWDGIGVRRDGEEEKPQEKKVGATSYQSLSRSLAFRIRIRVTNLVLDLRNLAIPRDPARGLASYFNPKPGQVYCVCMRSFKTEVKVNISKTEVSSSRTRYPDFPFETRAAATPVAS
jgi:hypothetical protein